MMRIAIVIPSAEFFANAGATVRYERLIDAAQPGTLRMVPLDMLTEDDDGYLFSKVYHPLAPALAAHLAARGKRVVLDVFDDYFTPSRNIRLSPYRRWFAQMCAHVDALTVSTDALARRLAPLAGHAPIVVPDPAPHVSPDALARTLATRDAPDPERLHFGWFGIAANRLFPVGLADLAAFAAALGDAPGRPRLSVLTNLSGADDTTLAALSRAPLPVSLEPWSPAAEGELIARADAVVLPANTQAFSTAKGLNRAITALAGGTQVISLGAPLYAALDPFIYRSVDAFVADAVAGELRHRADCVPAFVDALHRHADGPTAVAALLSAFEQARPAPHPPVAALLGRMEPPPGLKISMPLTIRAGFSHATDADVTLGPNVHLSERAIAALPRRLRRKVRRGQLPARALGTPPPPAAGPPANAMRARLRVMTERERAQAMAEALFPDHTILFADDRIVP